MINRQMLLEFVKPYYADKDIMHNMWHIELVEKKVEEIIAAGNYQVNRENLLLAVYFHGFIYKDEAAIITWLREYGYSEAQIGKIVQIAWESQRKEIPATLEGKILHDAHILEGGKTYKDSDHWFCKRTVFKGNDGIYGKNVLDKNVCYLPETIPQCDEMNCFARDFLTALQQGVR